MDLRQAGFCNPADNADHDSPIAKVAYYDHQVMHAAAEASCICRQGTAANPAAPHRVAVSSSQLHCWHVYLLQ